MSNTLMVKNLKKVYGKGNSRVEALKGISFNIDKGEFVGIMGASGSGKTTLLNIIATIDSQTSGKVLIDGREVNKLSDEKMCDFRRENLGFVFQDSNLLDTLTIRENIVLPLSLGNSKAKDMNKGAEELGQLLGIYETLDKYPYETSGGQKQRAAVCRAMITNPSLILADEPTGALDSKSARVLLENFKKINEDLKVTLMMVTHDSFSASYCNRIIFIKDGVIFSELRKGGTREEFHKKILDTLSVIGGV
ncbi:ABC transporter ATP-binding protein [Clostridium niameyense]|uniref:ABC transporter ATP-binding protein n=1 Tax=Clostridium niameyense TaxID=1622073 RepID=A0A6M0RA55_9CLOT|nr:ABC transporter ATP-binding protein [Clostridium niameyense]NEZ46479.1 ABC transporter ATP-binding protein [Clostridium niameyense]